MIKHRHDFEIVLEEVLRDKSTQVIKECTCGEQRVERNRSGIWLKI